MPGENEKPQVPCLPGAGCAPLVAVRLDVGAMSAKFDGFIAAAQHSMAEHGRTSEKVWENTTEQLRGMREEVGGLVDQLQECATETNKIVVRLTEGAGEFNRQDRDITNLGNAQREGFLQLKEAIALTAKTAAANLKTAEEDQAAALKEHESGEHGAHAMLMFRIKLLTGAISLTFLGLCVVGGIVAKNHLADVIAWIMSSI